MTYHRKTSDEFHIMADYGFGMETVTVELTFKEAKEQKKIYIENDPRHYIIKKKRVKIERLQSDSE